MADKLVGVARTLWIEHPCVTDHDSVLKRRAKRIARAPELAHIPHEAERAGARDIASERIRGAIECHLLAPDERMVERDLGLNPQAAPIGTQLAKRCAERSPNRLEHANEAAGLVERLESDLVDGGHERRRAAIHDRHFRPVDLDHCVVHAEPAQCRKHMLGGGHERARRISQDCRKFSGGDGVDASADFSLALPLQPRPNKCDS